MKAPSRNARAVAALRWSVLGAVVASTTLAFAQSGGGYDLHWNVSGAGGGVLNGNGYTLGATVLQAGANPAGAPSANGYALTGGFWAGVHENDLIFRNGFD